MQNNNSTKYISPKISDFLVDEFNSRYIIRRNEYLSPQQSKPNEYMLPGLENINAEACLKCKKSQICVCRSVTEKDLIDTKLFNTFDKMSMRKQSTDAIWLNKTENLKAKIKELETKIHMMELEKKELKILVDTQLNTLAILQVENKKYKSKWNESEKIFNHNKQLNDKILSMNIELQAAFKRIHELETENSRLLSSKQSDVISKIRKYINYIMSIIEGFNENHFARISFNDCFMKPNYTIHDALNTSSYEFLALKAYQYATDLVMNINSMSNSLISPSPIDVLTPKSCNKTDIFHSNRQSNRSFNSHLESLGKTKNATSEQKCDYYPERSFSVIYQNESVLTTEETLQLKTGSQNSLNKDLGEKINIQHQIHPLKTFYSNEKCKSIPHIFENDPAFYDKDNNKMNLSGKNSMIGEQYDPSSPQLSPFTSVIESNDHSVASASYFSFLTGVKNSSILKNTNKENCSKIVKPIDLLPCAQNNRSPTSKPRVYEEVKMGPVISSLGNKIKIHSANEACDKKKHDSNADCSSSTIGVPKLNLNALAQVKELDDEVMNTTLQYTYSNKNIQTISPRFQESTKNNNITENSKPKESSTFRNSEDPDYGYKLSASDSNLPKKISKFSLTSEKNTSRANHRPNNVQFFMYSQKNVHSSLEHSTRKKHPDNLNVIYITPRSKLNDESPMLSDISNKPTKNKHIESNQLTEDKCSTDLFAVSFSNNNDQNSDFPMNNTPVNAKQGTDCGSNNIYTGVDAYPIYQNIKF